MLRESTYQSVSAFLCEIEGIMRLFKKSLF